MAEAFPDGFRTVLRFWYSSSSSLPSALELQAAATWSNFAAVTIIYTNVPAEEWEGKLTGDVQFQSIEQFIQAYTFAQPALMKDIFQFDIVSVQAGWFLDWDVCLIDQRLLPRDDYALGSEWVKATGITAPTRGFIPDSSTRLSLAVTRFQMGDVVAARIAEALKANAKQQQSITSKSDPR